MSNRIKIYGERNTNTRYIETLIQLNLDAVQLKGVVPGYIKTTQKILPGKNWLRDLYFSQSYKQNLGWKHSQVKSIHELNDYDILRRNICFVSITKNPYSWLLSLHRKPYNQQYRQKEHDFESFLQTPWRTDARDNCEKLLENPIVLWNIKNSSYLELANLNGLNITTEGVIRDPESVIDKIAVHFSIGKLGHKFINYEKSTKDAGKSFAFYQDYYLNERWRDEISEKAIAIINKAVDKTLMKQFDYKVLGNI